jgi:ApbE superfamily uncharacterized protein (UPF0280 family)
MFIEVGPASLVVQVEQNGKAIGIGRKQIEKRVAAILEQIRDCLPVLKQKAYKIKNISRLPEVAKTMVEAVKKVDEASLTPMAAVAGSVSDIIKNFLKRENPDFISINNGGDISIFNKTGRSFRVAIGDINFGKSTPYTLKIEWINDLGIATSGFGGRSFTSGLADIVSVIGPTGAIADAAATYICNRTNIESTDVIRKRASDIDPMTDIPDEFVTVRIGDLDKELVSAAIKNGLTAAQELKQNNVIHDAILIFRRNMATTIADDKNIILEVRYGN